MASMRTQPHRLLVLDWAFFSLLLGGLFLLQLRVYFQPLGVGDALYYGVASLFHAGVLLLPGLLLGLLLGLPARGMRPLGRGAFYLYSLVVLLLALLDVVVYGLFRFHLNGMVLELLAGPSPADVFQFGASQWIMAAGAVALLLAVAVGFWRLGSWLVGRMKRRGIIVLVVGFLGLGLGANAAHMLSAARGYTPVMDLSDLLPHYFPLRANRFLARIGWGANGDVYRVDIRQGAASMRYPRDPIVIRDSVPKKHILLLLIDTWNPLTLNDSVMPFMARFARKSTYYTRHWSGSNGTKTGVFSLFYGISGVYFDNCMRSGTAPVLMDQLQFAGYQIRTYPSATLRNPPFSATVFCHTDSVRLDSWVEASYGGDMALTEHFIGDIQEFAKKDSAHQRPQFWFLFYDALHAFSMPRGLCHRFQPAWENADWLSLNNDSDPTLLLNLYRNTAHFVDSLVRRAVSALDSLGLLQNTVVVVTGDHSQEFNDNRKNYWGHASNLSAAQLHVPLLLYDADVQPDTVQRWTSHYDVSPTLLRHYLGVCNPLDDYSQGFDLRDTLQPDFLLVGSEDDWAILYHGCIYRVHPSGRLIATDSVLNATQEPLPPAIFNRATEQRRCFLAR